MGTFVLLLLILFLVPFLLSLLLRRWQFIVLTAASGVVLTVLGWKSGSAGDGAGAPFGLAFVMVSAAGLAIGLIMQAVRLWLASRKPKAAIDARGYSR